MFAETVTKNGNGDNHMEMMVMMILMIDYRISISSIINETIKVRFTRCKHKKVKSHG